MGMPARLNVQEQTSAHIPRIFLLDYPSALRVLELLSGIPDSESAILAAKSDSPVAYYLQKKGIPGGELKPGEERLLRGIGPAHTTFSGYGFGLGPLTVLSLTGLGLNRYDSESMKTKGNETHAFFLQDGDNPDGLAKLVAENRGTFNVIVPALTNIAMLAEQVPRYNRADYPDRTEEFHARAEKRVEVKAHRVLYGQELVQRVIGDNYNFTSGNMGTIRSPVILMTVSPK